MIHTPPYLGDYAAGSTVYVYWDSFGSNDESITQSGLAVTDIEVYKNNSMTQRYSDSGYTLLDTDGTDLDGATGHHGISIDLSDNSDAGFFAIGNDYRVVISAVTINAQTVRFCGGTFSIENRASANGVGDYAVTLTIRTTGGTPISGVSVWVNTSNSRSGSVAGTKVTDTNGQVTFNLEYTTYYIFCHLSGYTFASASFTAAAGSVSFTKDIGTAVSTGSASFYSESFLSRADTEVRDAIDEPTVKAKWTTSKVINYLEKAYILILNEVNRNSKTPIVARFDITVASGTTEYVLPHTVGSVYAIYNTDATGSKIFFDSRSRHNPLGRHIWVEGQTVHIQTTDLLGIGTTLTVEYIPSGIARLHNGTCTISANGLIVTFGATPNAGTLDTHHNGYAGSIFRCLGVDGTTVTGNYLQERNITAYDETTRQATLDVALSPIPTTDDGNIYYEIAPAIHKGMDTVVAQYAAYLIMTREGNMKRASGILRGYQQEIRNVRLTTYYTMLKEASRMHGGNYDNRRYRQI